MKRKLKIRNIGKLLLLSTVIMTLTAFISDEKSKKVMSTQKRLLTSKSWKCVGVSTGDTTIVDSAFTKIIMHFLPNNYYVSQYDTLVTYGKWRFNKSKNKIQLLNPDGQKITFEIVLLNSSTFNYKYSIAYNDTITLSSTFKMEPIAKRHKKCNEVEILTEEVDSE